MKKPKRAQTKLKNTELSANVQEVDDALKEALFKIVNLVNSTQDLVTFYKEIHHIVSTLTQSKNFYIALYHPESNQISFPYYHDDFDDEQDKDEPLHNPKKLMPVEKFINGPTWKVIDSGQVLHLSKKDLPTGSIGKPAENWLGIPLIHNKQVFGALVVQSYQAGFVYTNKDKDLLIYISKHISTTLRIKQDTEQLKSAHKKLQQYNLELEERVNERTKELKEINQQLSDANRLKSEFLSTMSHEIRTPMNGIMGMTELMLSTKLTNQQHNYAHTIINSADALLNIINDILDFSKVESGKLELETIPFDLMKVVEDTAELLAIKAREESIELIVHYAPQTKRYLLGDPGRIRQIITNLVGNAIKFTNHGYVSIMVEPANTATTPKGKQCIKVSVQDTGIGIEEAIQDKIFEKFSQADASTTRQYGGTGLGLAISHELSQLMGGDIGVESIVGEGSTFWFTMLLSDSIEEAHESAPAPSNLKGLRLLVVDDIKLNGDLIQQCFEPLGVECTIEVHSSNAVAILETAVKEKKPFDIVIIDYLMPHINGDVLAKTIKSTEGISDITMIMLTSSGGVGYARFFKESHFSAYLTKPIKTSALIELTSSVRDKVSQGEKNIFITVDDLQAAQTASLEYHNIHFKSPSVLLAEDNRVNQVLAVELLEAAGCQVNVVTNGKQAVERVNETEFDLIFMDCMMPEMDGFEASLIITADYQKKGVTKAPIIALTGNAMKGDREHCLASGMNDYLTKPIRKNQLLRTVAKWLPDFVDKGSHKDSVSFEGYKLLLVEDNRINAAMAEQILVDLGLEVIIAENGEEGVQAITEAKFDMVFMDCMMPIMDGFKATQEIRKLEEEGGIAYCPIVALTANAMKGDREACIASGMDDYFTKPFKKEVMLEMLSRYLEPTIVETESLKEDVMENGFDQKLFDNYRHIMGEKFERSIAHFIEDSKTMLQQLEEAYAAENIQEVYRISHTIKSVGAMVGAMEFSDIALMLEEEAKKHITTTQAGSTLSEYIIERLKVSFDKIEQHIIKTTCSY